MVTNSAITKRQLTECVFALCRNWQMRLVPSDFDMPVYNPNFLDAKLITSTQFLRSQNMIGYNIFGRPLSNRHILVDDLHVDALDDLVEAGLAPAVVIETSKANYQAWLTVSDQDLNEAVAAATARILAERFGGDIRSAKAGQLGRLPGFTNRKDKHESHGLYPFTRIARRVRRGVAPGADALLREAEERARQAPALWSSGAGLTSLDRLTPSNVLTPQEAQDIYAECVDRARFRRGVSVFEDDRSSLDFAVACSLIGSGFDEQDAATVLMYGSDKAAKRGEEYVLRTVRNAAQRVAELSGA